jgi:ankyrin repeat protein
MKHLLLTTIAAVVLVGCGGPSEAELALMDAARGGDIQAVKHHLAAGVDVNVIYKGQTPLHLAATFRTPSIGNQRKEIVELLIAAGADVNAKDEGGQTPLHKAASGGHKEIVELLIAKGADVNAKISDGFHKGDTPLDNAKHKPEIVDLLRKHGGKTLYELSIWKAAFGGSIEAIKQHIAAGTDLNAKDTYGWIPLNHAAEGGHKEIIELLIANGADVNAQNVDGYTPLHTAILNDETEIAKLLITKGADVNAQNGGGPAPLHLAAGFGRKEIAELLIAAGADVNAKEIGDETPLDYAETVYEDYSSELKAAKKEIADLLRKHGGKTGEELKAEGK